MSFFLIHFFVHNFNLLENPVDWLVGWLVLVSGKIHDLIIK